MKVGDLVRLHPGIRHEKSKQHPSEWIGIILKMHAKTLPQSGSMQGVVVCWNYPSFQEEMKWSHQLEVVNENR
jgi:hypothetical protein